MNNNISACGDGGGCSNDWFAIYLMCLLVLTMNGVRWYNNMYAYQRGQSKVGEVVQ